MPRAYKPSPTGLCYTKYDRELLQEAVQDYKTSGNSLSVIASKYNIDKSVLHRHSKRSMKTQGGQTILTEETELNLIKCINLSTERGYPLNSKEIRLLFKKYLDKVDQQVTKFENNLPHQDFVLSFLKRHKNRIKPNNQNKERLLASVSKDTIKDYFQALEVNLADIEPCNIINYDVTSLTIDTEQENYITKLRTKYPARVTHHLKTSASILISVTATGILLPPSIVYKAWNIHDTWRDNGPPGTQYNCTKSSWFDAKAYEDWMKNIIIPYFRGKEGKKVLIGDNLCPHLSFDVMLMCNKEDISFIHIPPNTTHLTHPLDVALFRGIKFHWRNILQQMRTAEKKQVSGSEKYFPILLKKLYEDLEDNCKANILSGFQKTGIWPLNADQVLNKLQIEYNQDKEESAVTSSILDFIKEKKLNSKHNTKSKRKRKLVKNTGNEESLDDIKIKTKKSRDKTVKKECDSTAIIKKNIITYQRRNRNLAVIKNKEKELVSTDTEEKNKMRVEIIENLRKYRKRRKSKEFTVNSKLFSEKSDSKTTPSLFEDLECRETVMLGVSQTEMICNKSSNLSQNSNDCGSLNVDIFTLDGETPSAMPYTVNIEKSRKVYKNVKLKKN